MRNLIIQTKALVRWVAAITLAAALASSATAQTLTDSYPHPATKHQTSQKPTTATRMTACPEFGAGFYRIDGSNTCVRIGGFIEAGVGGLR